MDILIILGTGALTSLILEKIIWKKEHWKGNLRHVFAFGFINFAITFVTCRLLNINIIFHSEIGNCLELRILTVGLLFLISILTAFVIAFIIAHIDITCICEKESGEQVNDKTEK